MKSVLAILLIGAIGTMTSVSLASDVTTQKAKELTIAIGHYERVECTIVDTLQVAQIAVEVDSIVLPEAILGNYSPCSKEGNIYNWKEPHRIHDKKWVWRS